MEDVVAILPEHVIDKIAAGEVVERPASVVKELVENALDAGARTITVDIEAGGRRRIRVVDDGCGMSPSDARRALARHATSKLRDVDDLWGLSTMGFRGEALPSIASVSRMTLTTRRAGDLAATRLELEGGRVLGVGEAGAPPGTCIDVCDLLYNVPARLEFLKGEATEGSHVTEVVQRLAMAHPDVHLRLRAGGRTIVDASPCGEGMERARMLLGARIGDRLHVASGEDDGVRVTAYLAAPDLAMTTARGVQCYVGRRFVRDRNLLHAVAMGYGELVPRGRYPVAVVFVDVRAGAVDVNVHPQKLEVRFSDAPAVASVVRGVVRRGVASSGWLSETSRSVRMTAATWAPMVARETARPRPQTSGLRLQVPQQRIATGSAPILVRTPDPIPDLLPGPEARGPRPEAFFSSLRYLGQLDRTYLVCEAAGELVLIDQHAAHERVELEKLRARGGADVAVQRLLFPLTIESEHAAMVAQLADVLGAVGFELEPFGGTTIAVKAMPAGLRQDPKLVLDELLGELAEAGDALQARTDRVLATIACHSVVRAGDTLSPREAEALLAQMDGVDLAGPNPHGRPVLLRLGIAEIARRFGR